MNPCSWFFHEITRAVNRASVESQWEQRDKLDRGIFLRWSLSIVYQNSIEHVWVRPPSHVSQSSRFFHLSFNFLQNVRLLLQAFFCFTWCITYYKEFCVMSLSVCLLHCTTPTLLKYSSRLLQWVAIYHDIWNSPSDTGPDDLFILSGENVYAYSLSVYIFSILRIRLPSFQTCSVAVSFVDLNSCVSENEVQYHWSSKELTILVYVVKDVDVYCRNLMILCVFFASMHITHKFFHYYFSYWSIFLLLYNSPRSSWLKQCVSPYPSRFQTDDLHHFDHRSLQEPIFEYEIIYVYDLSYSEYHIPARSVLPHSWQYIYGYGHRSSEYVTLTKREKRVAIFSSTSIRYPLYCSNLYGVPLVLSCSFSKSYQEVHVVLFQVCMESRSRFFDFFDLHPFPEFEHHYSRSSRAIM